MYVKKEENYYYNYLFYRGYRASLYKGQYYQNHGTCLKNETHGVEITFPTFHSALLKKVGLNKILDRPDLMPGAAIHQRDAAVIFASGCLWFSVL